MEPANQPLAPSLGTGSNECLTDITGGSLLERKEKQLKEVQDQIESYNRMVKVLASQRESAVKVLSDMDSRIAKLTKELEMERVKVEAKDRELKTKRTQLQKLRDEENILKEKYNLGKKELDSTAENLTSSQLNESQVKSKIQELQEFLTTTNAAIDDIEKAISIKDTIKLSTLCNQPLTPPPLSINSLLTNGINTNPMGNPTTSMNAGQYAHDNPRHINENSNSLFDDQANFDPFANEDPFDGEDPFKTEEADLALPEDDPFNPTSTSASNTLINAQNDPFAPLRPSSTTTRGQSPLGF